jgi:hypothetical protein
MIQFPADENFNHEIIRGVQRRVPDVHFLRVQDTQLARQPDLVLIEWAAEHQYLVLSHDENTMRAHFYTRLKAGLTVPPVFLVHGTQPVGPVIDTLELIVKASDTTEWQGRIEFLPF